MLMILKIAASTLCLYYAYFYYITLLKLNYAEIQKHH